VRTRIVSEWLGQGSGFELRVSIPVGATATFFVPARDKGGAQESVRTIDRATGVRFVRMEKDVAVLAVEPGRYKFV